MPPASPTALEGPCLKKKFSTAAACRCCYGCSDGAANQLPPERKDCCFSVGPEGGLGRRLGKGAGDGREGGLEEGEARTRPSPGRFH